jgi:signal peptidase I
LPSDQHEKDEAKKKNPAADWTKSILMALALFFVIRTFLVQTYVITSGSMERTLLVGDMLVVNRLAIGSRIPGTQIRIPGYSTPRRGDVLVFDPHHEVDMMLVKRLIGLPGDTLEMRNAALFLNDEPLDEPYLNDVRRRDDRSPDMAWQREYLVASVDPDTYEPSRHDWGPIVVPDGYYFMLGDNRDESLDSRYWGLLEAWRLEGRVLFKYFSYNRGSHRPFPALREIRWGRIGRGLSSGD